MWLVLAPAADSSALWVWQGLRGRGLVPVEFVSVELLVRSPRWVHRLGGAGESTAVVLSDGRLIRSEEVRGALNRIGWVAPETLTGVAEEDREYAGQELHAFFLSWLNALPGNVLGRPTPQGLCGRWRHLSEWVVLAALAGLPTPTYRQGSVDAAEAAPFSLAPPGAPLRTVIAVNGRSVGRGAPPAILAGASHLAALAGSDLLGVDFAVAPDGEWMFAGASPAPDLAAGGEELLELLAATLRNGNGTVA
jgi:hypothetical protein